MFFFFRKPKIVVDCFTPFQSVYDFYKIDKASKFFPTEVTSLPKYIEVKNPETNINYNISSLKNCVGLKNLYRMGFIIPMWTDFICQPKTHSKNESALGMMVLPFNFQTHPKEQYDGLFSQYLHCKFQSPWRIKENTGVSFTWNSALWNMQQHFSNFDVLPGVVTYNYQSQTNINIMIDRNSENFTIKAGQPLVHMIPITDKRVEIKQHLVSFEEFNSIGIPEEFGKPNPDRYKKYVNEMNKLEDNKPKCPFGFGK